MKVSASKLLLAKKERERELNLPAAISSFWLCFVYGLPNLESPKNGIYIFFCIIIIFIAFQMLISQIGCDGL